MHCLQDLGSGPLQDSQSVSKGWRLGESGVMGGQGKGGVMARVGRWGYMGGWGYGKGKVGQGEGGGREVELGKLLYSN